MPDKTEGVVIGRARREDVLVEVHVVVVHRNELAVLQKRKLEAVAGAEDYLIVYAMLQEANLPNCEKILRTGPAFCRKAQNALLQK